MRVGFVGFGILRRQHVGQAAESRHDLIVHDVRREPAVCNLTDG